MTGLLAGVRTFAGLSRNDLAALAARAQLQELQPHAVLFERGDQDPWMHCLLEGTLALRVRAVIDDDDCDIDAVARIVSRDVPLGAKLISAANSPVFYGTEKVDTCERAIIRLGLKSTRQLVMAFAMREVFSIKAPALTAMVRALWDHSIEVGAIAFALARRTRGFDPGEAHMAGLLHDIGVVPVLCEAAGRPQRSGEAWAVVATAARVRAALGRQVLEQWHFPPALVDAVADAEDWSRDAAPEPDLTDLVIVAQLLGFIARSRIPDVPRVVELPAFRKLLGPEFDAAAAAALLDEGRDQIEEMRRLLSS